MRNFINLGDLRDPAIPEAKVALIDCRLWESPRSLSHTPNSGSMLPYRRRGIGMNIPLPQSQIEWLKAQVAAGRFASLEEAVASAMQGVPSFRCTKLAAPPRNY